MLLEIKLVWSSVHKNKITKLLYVAYIHFPKFCINQNSKMTSGIQIVTQPLALHSTFLFLHLSNVQMTVKASNSVYNVTGPPQNEITHLR